MRDDTSRRRGTTHDRRRFLQTVGAVGLGLAASSTASASEHEGTTGIDSCTVIDEPGEYEIVADIEPEEVIDIDDPSRAGPEDVSCTEIRASDVTLHGNGHTIDGHAAQEGNGREGHAIGVNTYFEYSDLDMVENVVVEDVHVTGFRTGVRFEAIDGGRITDIVARDNVDGIGFHLGGVNGIAVENNGLIENGYGFNTYGDPDVSGGPSGNAIEHNDIESNATGVRLGHETHDHTFRYNRIVENGNGADHSPLFTSGNDYHHNAICRNDAYGIQNRDMVYGDIGFEGEGSEDPIEDVVDATENYWGAANGPSSYGDPAEPFTDPETGRPADGDGDAISESFDPGVANVRFDPFLEQFPEDAGADL